MAGSAKASKPTQPANASGENIPNDGRGRPKLTDWHKLEVGERSFRKGGSTTFLNERYAPREFVMRDGYIWRVA